MNFPWRLQIHSFFNISYDKVAAIINDQLIEIRKSRQQEYIISNCNAAINGISKYTQINNYDINKKSNSHEVVDNAAPKAKTKAWSRGTFIVIADSMLSYIDEAHTSRKFNVKVRSFPGAKTDDMYSYLVPLLQKNPDYDIPDVGTNDAADHQSNDIISKIYLN